LSALTDLYAMFDFTGRHNHSLVFNIHCLFISSTSAVNTIFSSRPCVRTSSKHAQ